MVNLDQWLTNGRLVSWWDYAMWFVLIAFVVISDIIARGCRRLFQRAKGVVRRR